MGAKLVIHDGSVLSSASVTKFPCALGRYDMENELFSGDDEICHFVMNGCEA